MTRYCKHKKEKRVEEYNLMSLVENGLEGDLSKIQKHLKTVTEFNETF